MEGQSGEAPADDLDARMAQRRQQQELDGATTAPAAGRGSPSPQPGR